MRLVMQEIVPQLRPAVKSSLPRLVPLAQYCPLVGLASLGEGAQHRLLSSDYN